MKTYELAFMLDSTALLASNFKNIEDAQSILSEYAHKLSLISLDNPNPSNIGVLEFTDSTETTFIIPISKILAAYLVANTEKYIAVKKAAKSEVDELGSSKLGFHT